MNKILKIIGLVLLIVGAVISNFSTIPVGDYVGIATSAFGLALTIIAVWKGSEKKSWTEVVGIICFAIAGFMLGVAGMAKETMVTLITSIAAVVALIIGVVVTFIIKDKPVE